MLLGGIAVAVSAQVQGHGPVVLPEMGELGGQVSPVTQDPVHQDYRRVALATFLIAEPHSAPNQLCHPEIITEAGGAPSRMPGSVDAGKFLCRGPMSPAHGLRYTGIDRAPSATSHRTENAVSTTIANMSVSLDGYVNHPTDGVTSVFEWYTAGGDVELEIDPRYDFQLDEQQREAARRGRRRDRRARCRPPTL